MPPHTPLDILVCIYTCERHVGFLESFYRSDFFGYLSSLPNIKTVEVYANPNIPTSYHSDNTLILRAKEEYKALSIKTFEMINYAVSHFRFRRLLKIDVTTVMTTFEGREYEGRKPIDASSLTHFLQTSPVTKDYDGYLLHANVTKENVLTYAAKKGAVIDYDTLFGNRNIPPFYDGKCYFVSSHFAEFISQRGLETAKRYLEHMWGVEDVMIGSLFQDYVKSL